MWKSVVAYLKQYSRVSIVLTNIWAKIQTQNILNINQGFNSNILSHSKHKVRWNNQLYETEAKYQENPKLSSP